MNILFACRVLETFLNQPAFTADIELIKNNATVGSQIAVELTRLQENSGDGKGGAGGGDNGISHAWNRTATGALFGSSSHSSNGGQSQSMQMSSNGNLRQEQRVSFGSPPPSFPSMQPLGNYGSDGMTTFGNVPPPEYADNIANSTSASSIDNDLMAEFQALLPVSSFRHSGMETCQILCSRPVLI